MASQVLPIDVLLLIMEVSPLSTIGKMTRTCRAIRQGGARFLLDGGASLITGSSVISFVQFMHTDAINRFRFLRSLDIVTGELRPREVDALLGLISHPLLALDSLTLREADLMLKSIPTHSRSTKNADPTPLVTAFAALTTLRHLTVDECDQRTCSLITAIRAPLTTISIGFTPLSAWHTSEDAEHRNPIVLLANVSDTLEEISASNVAMAIDPLMYDVVYPSIRRMSVTYDLTWIPKTVAYTTAFPHLAQLSFTAAHGSTEFFHAAITRTANRATLERHGRSWEHLQELSGNLSDVFMLGLTCHVPKVRFTGPLSLDTLIALEDVLKDVRPTCLALTVVGAHLFEDDSMTAILAVPYAQDLRALEMEVCLDVDEGLVDAHGILGVVARTLDLLPLHNLTLTLNYGLFAATDEADLPLCPARKSFEDLDLEAADGLLRETIPSLVDVVVRLSTDCKWYETYADQGGDGSDSSGYISPLSQDSDELEGDLGGFMMEEDDQGW